ncbi:MAG: transglutaminase domain-containing protein, partial [Alphaproteobacteria bacterium]|nr:transglutaminase domain-containing protein [Alphaproteobacteria bacterium]
NKNVVCEGYARTFKYLMDELEIPCVLVSGIAVDEDGKSERHAWNYVYLKNDWYAIDVTWDDPIIIGNGRVDSNIKYKYFLKGSNTMNKDHTSSGQITK